MKYLRIFLMAFTVVVLVNAANAQRAIPAAKIDKLYVELKSAGSYEEARQIEQQLWDSWNVDSTNARARELMWLGIISMEQNELDSAVLMFDGVIKNDPDWAEGWNKRATINFFLGEYESSIRDIKETLVREPRHFGALTGMAHIFTAMEDDESAMIFFRRALSYHPYMKDARVVLQVLESRRKTHQDK